MRIGDKMTKFLTEKHFIKDFKVLDLQLDRKDGKVEDFLIAVEKGFDFFTMEASIIYPQEEAKQHSEKVHISKLNNVLEATFRSLRKKDFKRIKVIQGEGSIWIDLQEK